MMEQVPAVVTEDVRPEEESTVMDVAPCTPTDGTSANSDAPPREDTADSKCPVSVQEFGLFCQDCGEAFGEEAAYLDHRNQHPDGKCAMYLEPMDYSDEADEDEESTSSCQLCTLSFVDMNEFRSHMETHRVQSSGTQEISGFTKQNSFECSDCGKRYSMLGHFLNHQRTHIQASKSLFSDLEDLKKKSFQCETCGRNYSRASALDAHRRGHEEKLFKRRYKTSRHMTTTDESTLKLIGKQTYGTPEKLFKCACGKTFPSMVRLKTHQRFSHNSECFPQEATGKLRKNVFYCRECRKVFHGHLAWFNHEKWHENHSKDSPNRFPCESCGKVFMTQTFYYRHNRMVHSGETPAKSFLHQVGQLQKKGFECTDCGLKFSRPSALHSHQLQHTSAFGETEKVSQAHSSLLHQETWDGELKGTQQLSHHVLAENVLADIRSEDDPHVNEPDEDVMESYEPGDFNVLVISASESEDEAVQDMNPHLESGSASDQEGRDNVSASNLVSKPELDLKIVQVDFEPAKGQRSPAAEAAEDNATKERFDCPECYRWFTSAASLRAHIVWHNFRKRRRQTKANQSKVAQDCGPTSTASLDYLGTRRKVLKDDQDIKVDENLESEKDLQKSADGPDMRGSPSTEGSMKCMYRCQICGKVYMYLLSFQKHLELHTGKKPIPKSPIGESARKYDCPICGMEFYRKTRLRGHLLTHMSREVHRCDQCNKTFDNLSLWLGHEEFHKTRPFWCLSCSKGFMQEDYLNKHLQRHHLGTYKCLICSKRFFTSRLLGDHLSSSHASSQPVVGSASLKMAAAGSGDESVMEDGSVLSANDKDEQEPQTCVETEGSLQTSGNFEKSGELFENREFSQSNVSDCGDLVQQPPKSSTAPAGEELRKAGVAQTTQEINSGEQPEDGDDHKHWEFECFECGTGFDDITLLHLHYVKHATGDLPFPDTEG
ncbi:zinc finger protein 135 isoform X3 [Phyllopteryx taeniolatus]|uniref:zinc finger protein 135 isoform X3 n=1 Tax=Phyllopteryx taeniolatus TaxID=161469 RepID=UPI002AD58E05|nr:zinc finger protein 135 isoform X3 [Phyllopteryx taeniolatus]